MITPTYEERLGVPLRWWAQGTMFVATLWLALVVAIPAALAFGLTAVALAVLAGGFWAYAIRIVVDDEVRVGRAHVGPQHLGTATALDAEATRRTAGVEADARAHLVLRPFTDRAVKIEITDERDPAPYWLVSTRHPDALARAVTALTAAGGHDLRSEHG